MENLFEEPKYIQNSLSLVFLRQQDVRRKANSIEDKLKEKYFPPQIIPIPDDIEPEAPRMIFGSKHGFSRIIVSQVNLVLDVTYSVDYQEDILKGQTYLLERVPMLFDLLKSLGEVKPYFCGLISRGRVQSQSSDDTIPLKILAKHFLSDKNIFQPYDIQVKVTNVVSGKFFSNITTQNYRSWSIGTHFQGIPHLPSNRALERGIEVIADFNDRYSFNENEDYQSTREVVEAILAEGLREVEKIMTQIKGMKL